MPATTEDKISSLMTAVSLLEEKLKDIVKHIDKSETISVSIREDINKILTIIADTTSKIEFHHSTQRDDKTFVLKNIEDIKQQVAELLEKSFSSSQLHSDVIALKNSLSLLSDQILIFKADFDGHKQMATKIVETNENHRNDMCVQHRKDVQRELDIFTKWKKEVVDVHIEDYKAFKTSLKTISWLIGFLLLLLTIISVSLNIHKVVQPSNNTGTPPALVK